MFLIPKKKRGWGGLEGGPFFGDGGGGGGGGGPTQGDFCLSISMRTFCDSFVLLFFSFLFLLFLSFLFSL